jgi:hypothetical protein
MRTEIKQIVYEMLTENTGRSLCDSGGYPEYDENGRYVRSTQGYGRHWERNKGKTIGEFENEEPVSVWLDTWGIDSSVSVFHHLTSSNLELDDVCEVFNKLNLLEGIEESECEDLYDVNDLAYKYLKTLGYEIQGNGFNSYNGDSHLTQVIQGEYISINDSIYLVLQIHQGTDVRGGYCTSRLFLCEEGYITSDYDDFIYPEYYEYYDIYSRQLGRYLNEKEKECVIDLLDNNKVRFDDEFVANLVEICDINNYLIGEDKQLELKYPSLEKQIKHIRSLYNTEQTKEVTTIW